MLSEKLKNYTLICGSGSPRRQFLLRELGLDFETRLSPVDENFPQHLKGEEIPLFLSKIKAEALKHTLGDKELLITADTIVWLDGKALNKPVDAEEARKMLGELSGKMHEVFTGVSLTTVQHQTSFCARTAVWFRDLSEEEIAWYVDRHKPFDKAGAYGAQEWIGYVGIEKMEGTYFNVMGLPLTELYTELVSFATR